MMATSERIKQLFCVVCKEWYDEDFFRVSKKFGMHAYRTLRCKGCEQVRRDKRKFANRWIEKARTTLNRHAKKYVLEGQATSRMDFIRKFGWNLIRIARDMEEKYAGRCCICDTPFAEMPNGIESITLDIWDPTKPPYYTSNVEFPCQTCNSGKWKTDPHVYARLLLNWDKWKLRQAELTNGGKENLFDGLPDDAILRTS